MESSFREWATKTFTKSDSVVIEMTTNTWEVYDFLVGICGRVVIVHPPAVHAMMPHTAKTDKRDAHALAVLLIGGQLEDKLVWVPDQATRELRTLIAQRYKSVRMAAVAKNRLHNVLHRHHIVLPTTADEPGWSTPFHVKHHDWWFNLTGLSNTEKLEIELNWETIRFGESQRERIEALLATMAAKDEAAILLQQLPGFGIITAMTVLGAVGDIARFSNADKLTGYAGLGSRVSSSGGKTHYGPDHQVRPQGPAPCHGRSRVARDPLPPALEGRVRAPRETHAQEQGQGRHRAQALDRGLASAQQSRDRRSRRSATVADSLYKFANAMSASTTWAGCRRLSSCAISWTNWASAAKSRSSRRTRQANA